MFIGILGNIWYYVKIQTNIISYFNQGGIDVIDIYIYKYSTLPNLLILTCVILIGTKHY